MDNRKENAATATMKTLPNFEIDRLRHLLTLPAEASVNTAQVKELLLEHIIKNGQFGWHNSDVSQRCIHTWNVCESKCL